MVPGLRGGTHLPGLASNLCVLRWDGELPRIISGILSDATTFAYVVFAKILAWTKYVQVRPRLGGRLPRILTSMAKWLRKGFEDIDRSVEWPLRPRTLAILCLVLQEAHVCLRFDN